MPPVENNNPGQVPPVPPSGPGSSGSPPTPPGPMQTPQPSQFQPSVNPVQPPTPNPQPTTPQVPSTPPIPPTPPGPMQTPQPLPTTPNPAPVVGQGGMPQMAPNQSKGKSKKLIAIILIALVAIIGIAVIAFAVLRFVGNSGVVKYNETQDVTLAGISDNSGMSFMIPTEMQEYVKTDISATYYHYYDNDNKDIGHQGEIGADIQTVSFIDDPTADQKKQFLDQFSQQDFENDLTNSIGYAQNFEYTNTETTDDSFNAEFNVELGKSQPGTDEEYLPAKGVFNVTINGRHAYYFIYVFPEDVFNANQGFLNNMEQSVQTGI